jgi:amino acid adenylation domain-containing protein
VFDRDAPPPTGIYTVGATIDSVAREYPELLAVADGTTELTYRELVATMHRLARAVQGRHPDPATPVVVLCEHGVPAVLAMIGVLAAGRLLVPLDVRDAHDRLAAIVSDSSATLVVTAREHAEAARAIAPRCALLLLDEADDLSDAPVDVDVDANTPGLVIFTSGSTGTPKGVVLAHSDLVAVGLRQGLCGRSLPGDRTPLTGSFSYVGACGAVLGALCNGASVITLDPRTHGPSSYPEWLNANGIRDIGFMAPLLRSLVDADDVPHMSAVREVRVSGDTVYGRDLVRARPLFADDVEFNLRYGTTETSSVASYRVGPGDDPDPGPMPLGTPNPWVEVRIVDPETDEPVPDGHAGRLVAISSFVALGYFNDPDLTAAHFFTTPDGRRGYRSGDLVRRRDDGLFEHLGRIDSRVKVRGALISPSEVERTMAGLDGVGTVAVVAEPLQDGGHRLVAYVVPLPGSTPTAAQLRRDVGRRLPTTMVPSAVVFLDSLPLTERGKLMPAALPPAPAPVRRPYRAPTGAEARLAELFEDVLGVDHVGRDDDFFDLGGDSLGVVELVAAIHERFGVDAVASTVLDAPTVASLAPRLGHRRDRHSSVVVPLHVAGGGTPVFCFTGGGAPALSLRVLAEALAAAGGEVHPFYALQPHGLEERASPDRTIGAAARRGLHAIRSTRPTGPFILGGYSFGATVAFDLASRMEADGLRVPLLVVLDTLAPGVRVPLTRRQRLARRRRQARASVVGSPLHRGATTTARGASIAWGSARAHAQRRVALMSAGLFPRQGLEQYEVFLRLNSAMSRAYRAMRTFAGPVIVVRSDATPTAASAPRDLGWSQFVTGPITVIDAPGGHLSMIRHPNVTTLANRLARAIDQVGA